MQAVQFGRRRMHSWDAQEARGEAAPKRVCTLLTTVLLFVLVSRSTFWLKR